MWYNGLLDLSWGQLISVTLVLTHITIVSVTLYLHRHSAHNALDLHPVLKHFFRFWLWLTTSINTREWTAVHRKHHATCETEQDPHSPVVKGIRKVLFQGAELYAEAATPETLERYGQRTPRDWIERRLYSRHRNLGITLMAVTNLVLFGVHGIWIWAIQMMWIPVWAAGVVNGLGHYIGYRNFECGDNARNLIPLAIWIGGEELHNNHHTYPNSARLSRRFRKLLYREISLIPPKDQLHLQAVLERHEVLRLIYDKSQELQALWRRRGLRPQEKLDALLTWCRDAEASGVRYLEEFAAHLRAYSLRPVPPQG